MPASTESPNGTVGTDPATVVTAFLGALEDLDVARAMTYAAPGMVYQNVPLPAARGAAAVEKQLTMMTRYATGFEVDMLNIAANGPVVLTERTDVLKAGGWEASFWVCGTFEVREGRIILWRDRFDWATFLAASVRGVPGLLLSLLNDRRGAAR